LFDIITHKKVYSHTYYLVAFITMMFVFLILRNIST